jgi:hypothetical protein
MTVHWRLLPRRYEPSSPELVSEYATILALSSSISDSAQDPTLIMFLPTRTYCSLPDSAEYLQHLPKPVACAAFASAGTMVIAAWPFLDRSTINEDFLPNLIEDAIKEGRELRRRISSVADVQLRDASKRLALELTFAECERWIQDYVLLLTSCTARFAQPNDVDNAVCTLTFGSPGGGQIGSSLSDVGRFG